MELEKLISLSDAELKQQEMQSAEQIFRLRFQKSLGNNEGLKKLKTLKLDIARIKTIARQRELGIGQTPRSAEIEAVSATKAAAKTASKPAAKSKTASKPAAAKKASTKKEKKD